LARLAAFLSVLVAVASGCVKSNQTPARAPQGRPRIVSLAPSVTETLFALGAGGDVVGVSQYCDYPPAALKLPQVGTFLTPNIEAIVALRPTLVIGLAISSDLREIRALRAMGIPTLMISDDSLAQIEHSIRRIGERLGRGSAAARLVGEIRYHTDAIAEQLKDLPAHRVLMLVGHQPLVAVGRGTFLDELLKLAHAINIADASWQPWPQLAIEYIIASRPEVILDGQMGTDPFMPGEFWTRYPSIPAVKHHRLYGYPQDPTLHSGPRVWQTLEILARLIHPEAFRERSAGRVAAAVTEAAP
jgi:cobalamin transport system substrate-binding protein